MSAQKSKENPILRVLKSAASDVGSVVRWLVRHWRLTAAVVIFGLLVVGPGFTAAQPDFYSRYENLGVLHDSWERSTHAQVPCQRCHVEPGFANQALYHVRATGEIWASLLPSDREPQLLGAPSNDACNACHVDLREVSPSGDLVPKHEGHVSPTALNIPCAKCHALTMVHNEDTSIEAENTPRMATCYECHDGVTAPDECSACHTAKALPISHLQAEWLTAHPTEPVGTCKECHEWISNWCSDCHSSRRPTSHGSAETTQTRSVWRAEHRDAIEARDARNCEACHTAEFCINCHGELPNLNLDSSLTLVQ